MSFTYYQRGGIYTGVHSRIVPAIREISRAVGVPDVAMSCLQPNGVGAHRTGEACDFQAGNADKYGDRYSEGFAVHEAIANYILDNWTRLKVRYMAWNGWEYGGSWGGKERKRKQTTNYGGSDPWHKYHVHVDFLAGAIAGARPDIEIGSAVGGSVAGGINLDSENYYLGSLTGSPDKALYGAMQRFLADRNYYRRQIDGDPGRYTWTALQEFLSDLGYFAPAPSGKRDMTTARALQRWLTNAGHYRGAVTAEWDKATWKAWQTYLRYAHKDTPVTRLSATKPQKEGLFMALTEKQEKQIHTQVMNISAAVKRSEARERDQLEISKQNNELLVELISILTDRDHSSKLLDKVWKTNAAVGRAEKARQEAEAREAELAEQDNEDEGATNEGN